jgi:hypothetical protein
VPKEPINPVTMPQVEVSNVDINEQSLSFDVDRTGVPVLVKVSYFPNWDAKGAEGPYRIGPNMMVVVPTSNHVEMTYGRSTSDYVTILLSLVGIGLCFVWRRKGDVVHASEEPAAWWWRGGSPAGAGALAMNPSEYDQFAEFDDRVERDGDLNGDFDDDFSDDLGDLDDLDDVDEAVRAPDQFGLTSEPTDPER